MKVLALHNFYHSSSPSGEDVVYRNEVELLKSKGISVIRHERHNDEISGPLQKIGTAFNTVWSGKTYREVSSLIRREKPDIAHFHNIWYLISPSAYYACKSAGIPVVQTLHNYRMFCANGLLLRNGSVCEKCVGNLPWRGLIHRCFRNSAVYSAPVVLSETIHRYKQTWSETVDAFIAMTDFSKEKFSECGLPGDRIFIKPNFLFDPPSPGVSEGGYALYLGRLSKEKGPDILINAMDTLSAAFPELQIRCKIAGDGPMKDELMNMTVSKGTGQVDILGRQSHSRCIELLSDAAFLVLPSVCYENFPVTILEAFASAKPVIASDIGAMAEIIRNNETGLLFKSGDSQDLCDKIRWLTTHHTERRCMGENARSVFENNYTADRNFEMLMNIYNKTLSGIYAATA